MELYARNADRIGPHSRRTIAPMLQTSARLLRLLTLLQTRRFWSGAALAERLEVTERTVRRDIDRLRSLGYPVRAAPGVTGGYQLEAGTSLPPLLLEDDEALAVSISLRTAAGGTVAGIEESALRALIKLEQVLPSRLRRRVNALHASIVPLGRPGPAVDPVVLATIAGACRDHEQLRFRYDDRKARTTYRTVEPQGLVHTGSRWYLVAWDLDRGDWRTFRVDRIGRKVTTGARFTPRQGPDGGDLAAYVSRSVSSVMNVVRASVILHAPRERVAERLSPMAGELTAIDAERCRLDTGAQSLLDLAVWLSLMEVEFEVLEPPELIDYLRRVHGRLERMLARVRSGSSRK
jgi:Predicted transcriptional regulator